MKCFHIKISSERQIAQLRKMGMRSSRVQSHTGSVSVSLNVLCSMFTVDSITIKHNLHNVTYKSAIEESVCIFL